VIATRSCVRSFDHERSQTKTTFDEPQVLEFAIGAVHRIGIDGDLTNHFAYRGQLVTGLQLAPLVGVSDLIDQLPEGSSVRTGIEPKDNGGTLFSHVLVH